jgi:16S rRNA (cytosine1402-N4)-methyltransferase
MHRPVLVNEVMALMDVRRGRTYVDGTVGSGGHAEAILERNAPDGLLLGIDRDAETLERAKQRLKRYGGRARLAHGNYADMERLVADSGVGAADGVLLDLGVSGEQLESAERGFSFRQDGPLDMRMDRTQEVTAAALVNELPEEELRRLLRDFGEETRSRFVARAMVRARQRRRIETTGGLDAVVRTAAWGRGGPPSARTFQALRIAVNRELEFLEAGIAAGLRILAVGGRLAVISFHSLEDRIAKQTFREWAGCARTETGGGAPDERVKILTRKVVRPGRDEVAENPRARSAKLRVVERIA